MECGIPKAGTHEKFSKLNLLLHVQDRLRNALTGYAADVERAVAMVKTAQDPKHGDYQVNCAMCHGQTSAKPGPVGRKLSPPPPGLDHDLVGSLSDAAIFKAITFGFGRMPTFRDKLIPQERWNLVNYLRARK